MWPRGASPGRITARSGVSLIARSGQTMTLPTRPRALRNLRRYPSPTTNGNCSHPSARPRRQGISPAAALPFATMKALPRPSSRLLPLILLVLISPLPFILRPPHRTFALTHIRSLSPPACLFLHLSHLRPPPFLPAPSICCVVLLPQHAPPATTNASSPHCHHLRLSEPALTLPARLAAALPLLRARFAFSWLVLPPPSSTHFSHTALSARLADLDPSSPVRAGLPHSPVPLVPSVAPAPHTLPDILHAAAQGFHFRDDLAVLSTAAVDSLADLARANSLRIPSNASQTLLLDDWLAGLTIRPLALPAVAYQDLDDPAACRLPAGAAVVTAVPPDRREACAAASASGLDIVPAQASVRDISFLVLPQGVRGDARPAEIYRSIRLAFPYNEIVFADLSADATVALELRDVAKGDAALNVKNFHPVIDAHVRNELVAAASRRYVCFVTDVQRLSWEARVGVMLRQVASGDADIAGGYLLRGSENAYEGRLGPELLVTETTVGYRYGFTDEMTLRREGVNLNQLAGRECFRAHRTSDFMLAERETLMRHQWRAQFGSLAHDEFFVRIMRKELKVAICESAVRHRYYAPPAQRDRQRTDWHLLRGEAKRLCLAWDEELGDIGGLAMRGLEFDCAKQRVCERTEKKGGDGTEFEKEWTCQRWGD